MGTWIQLDFMEILMKRNKASHLFCDNSNTALELPQDKILEIAHLTNVWLLF